MTYFLDLCYRSYKISSIEIRNPLGNPTEEFVSNCNINISRLCNW